MKTMTTLKAFAMSAILAVSTVACVEKADASNSVAVGYMNSEVLDDEGMEINLSHTTNDNTTLGARMSFNEDDVYTYGLYVGPTLTYNTGLSNVNLNLNPNVGLTYDDVNDIPVIDIGLKASNDVGLFADVRYSMEVDSDDKVGDDYDDVVYTVGLTTQF